MIRDMPVIARLAWILGLMILLGGCGAATPASTSPPTSSRPSSPATIEIVTPGDGSIVHGGMVNVTVAIQNAHIVQATSLNLRPDEGHVHLLLDGNVQRMGYTLAQSFSLAPATYTMQAEFVASDHVPFSPRVRSKKIVFTVA
jgi:hypothetical protein